MFLKRILSIGFLTAILFGSVVSNANAGYSGPTGLYCYAAESAGRYVMSLGYVYACYYDPSDDPGVTDVSLPTNTNIEVIEHTRGVVKVRTIFRGPVDLCIWGWRNGVWETKTCRAIQVV